MRPRLPANAHRRTPRLAATALGVFLGLAPMGVALAAGSARAYLSISADTTTVSGRPVEVLARLTDGQGKPVAGAMIRLESTVAFMGSERQEVMDEAKTGTSGRATLMFSPTETGPVQVTATSEGTPGLAPAHASLRFDVRSPVSVRDPAPVGIQAPWAKGFLILIPFVGVWIAYLVVLDQARRLRRAGARVAGAEGRTR